MGPRYCIALVWILGFATYSGAQTEGLELRVLNLPIFPAQLSQRDVPLTKTLGYVGSYVRRGYVLFGVELRLKNGQEPVVNVNLEPGSTLGDALRQIFDQLPGYRFEVLSAHMINIYPEDARWNPDDVLNLLVPRFDAVDVQPTDILVRPGDFIPELKARLAPKTSRGPQPSGSIGPGISGSGPTITLHMNNATVREILNAVSEAMEQFPQNYEPVGWLYAFRPDPASPIGGAHTWRFLWSAPRDWKEEAEKADKPSR